MMKIYRVEHVEHNKLQKRNEWIVNNSDKILTL